MKHPRYSIDRQEQGLAEVVRAEASVCADFELGVRIHGSEVAEGTCCRHGD